MNGKSNYHDWVGRIDMQDDDGPVSESVCFDFEVESFRRSRLLIGGHCLARNDSNKTCQHACNTGYSNHQSIPDGHLIDAVT